MSKTKKEKNIEDTRKFVEMVAKKNAWKLTRDVEFLDSIIDGLNANYNRYGYYSCPCRDGDGVKEEDKDIICPCDYCIPDQEEYGHCYCGLYLTQDFYDSGKETQGIPERRPL
ncbi:ferredoxin-thioredoxin reductase catalytic domain-containing protein [Promethearchaeum syntrophicum]|uniref:ferredoxin:thioredoxin reductase n=1 Tax=Promethearchaeum syntrophicum TaxID=2594042 RepID=A0A5B9D846_9ARCH|nr:ferredoxin-thioredoxin reductase catalytic domain-containing protein [Candidatus Prometheoarchaeum syntrophicum]QEE15304.1 Ferredoxin thioredoxin reductase catalytic beta chain [Candidatus Prometheoarchaeum syntrophicum]